MSARMTTFPQRRDDRHGRPVTRPVARPLRGRGGRRSGLALAAALVAGGAGIGEAALVAPGAAASSPAATAVHGVVASVRGTTLELRVRRTKGGASTSTVAIVLGPHTRYREGGHKATKGVLHAGERVRVRLAPKAPRQTAAAVAVLAPQWTGTVAGLGKGGFVLTGSNHRAVGHVVLTHTTKLREAGRPAPASALRDGARVRVTGAVSHGSMAASTVVLLGAHGG